MYNYPFRINFSPILVLLYFVCVTVVFGSTAPPSVEAEYDAKLGLFRISWESKEIPKLTREEGKAGVDYVLELIVDAEKGVTGIIVRGKTKINVVFGAWLCLIELNETKVKLRIIPNPNFKTPKKKVLK